MRKTVFSPARKVFLLSAALAGALFIISTKGNTTPNMEETLVESKINNAILKKYPEQIVLVTSADAAGKPNIITIGWTMFCSGRPPMVAISVGKTRYSHNLISRAGEFVYAFPGEDLQKEMLYCGTHSGRIVDKFKETGLTPVKAKIVKAPLIKECIANFECKIVGEYDGGDHTIFVGKVVTAWISKEGTQKRRLYNLGGGKFTGLP